MTMIWRHYDFIFLYVNRFSPEEKARHGPFDHMPFGYGPRNCIAMRLALLEVKLAAALVLKNFSLIATEKTKVSRPYYTRTHIHLIFLVADNLRLLKYTIW